MTQLAPKYRDLGQALFTAHTTARMADTVRLGSEPDSLWAWSETQRYIAQRPDDVAWYLSTVVTGGIRWTPSALKLTKGAALTAAQLNAYSDVLGTFTYSSALGTKLPIGKTTVTVTFTPSDLQLTGPQTTSRVFTVS